MSIEPDYPAIVLHRAAGSLEPPIEIARGDSVLIGRSRECRVVLEDQRVSRRHARLDHQRGRLIVTDLGSTHGTRLNGILLDPSAGAEARRGDRLRIGPFEFVVSMFGESPRLTTAAFDPGADSPSPVTALAVGSIASLASHRLELLIDAAASLQSCRDEQAITRNVLELFMRGTGFTIGAFCRPLADGAELEIMHQVNLPSRDGRVSISRSLLRSASEGRLMAIQGGAVGAAAVSIAAHGITTALGVPLLLDDNVVGVVYLDARGESHPGVDDLGAFCTALARFGALALGNLQRAAAAAREAARERELQAARAVQRGMMPPAEGRCGGLTYAALMQPGSIVSGDILDVIALDGEKLAVFLGDVAGKGAGAGMLTAALHAIVHCELRRTADPAAAARTANAYACAHTANHEFVSMWIGVIDQRGTLEYVDCGHGYALLSGPAGSRRIASDAGFVLGVVPDAAYESEQLRLAPGERLVLFSDGLIEQRSPAGAETGWERIQKWAALESGTSALPGHLLKSLGEHAGVANFTDDVTICVLGC